VSIIEVETYVPFAKQQKFHSSPAKYRLFGGAAGPGKSRALLEEAVIQANEVPGVNTLLLRRTFPELESTLIEQFRKHIDPKSYKSYNESKHIVEWWNGSTTRFGYCKSEHDIFQYQGAEYLFIGLDELTLFTLKQWQFLTSRNRCPVPGTFPNMAGATNPGNAGHKWVKALWIDKQPAPGMERPEQYDPAEYDFIPALISDNPIYANDAGYIKTLQSLPRWLSDALLLGHWNVFAGQYFDIWNSETMVDRPEEWGLQPWNPRWISIDYGFDHPAAAYWHTQDDKNRTLTYREYVQNRQTPTNFAKRVVELSGHADYQTSRPDDAERITDVYLSPDAFASRTGEATIAEQIGDVFARSGLPRPSQADNDRVGGWMLMYQMLDSGYWRIGSNCTALIKTLPALIRDEKKTDDVAKVDDALSNQAMMIDAVNCSGDDAADAARYGLKSRHSPGRKPVDVRIKERLEERIGMKLPEVKPENYTHVMMQRAIIADQEKRKDKPLRLISRSRRRR
jgi:hypothetical protein